MFFQRRTVPGLAIHSYVVGDEKTKACCVIDPVRDVDPYLILAKNHGLEIKHIIETHVHADFVSGACELKARLGDTPAIYCSGEGGKSWIPTYADRIVTEGDEIRMGALTLKAVHTPGHTPEHLMWVLYENHQIKKLFTGDFLFVGDIGRPDLLGKGAMDTLAGQLYNSIFHTLAPFPDEAEIRPAHGAGSLCGKALGNASSSTLGEERLNNRALQRISETQWIEALMKDMPLAPKYFARMKTVNVAGPRILGQEYPGRRALTSQELQKEMEKGTVILDVRSKEAFAAAYIPNSINIPKNPQLSTWAGWCVPDDVPLALVLEDEAHLEFVVKALIRVGLDRIVGFLKGGIWEWEDAALKTEHLKTLSVSDLHMILNKDPKTCVLDVRTEAEWNSGHIDGAVHLHAGSLQDHFDQLPKEGDISVICGSGFRASIASSLLRREGFQNVANVFGGMRAWQEAGLPIKTNF